jgi:hypothetical protein
MPKHDDQIIRGTLSGDEDSDPCWSSLYRVLRPETLADFFSYFGDVELEDGTTAHVYRNVRSRSFLHVTDDGRTLIYVGGEDRYRYVPAEDAVVNAFVSRRSPCVTFDDEAGAAALDAMHRVLCDVSDELGIERPQRDVVIPIPPLDGPENPHSAAA